MGVSYVILNGIKKYNNWDANRIYLDTFSATYGQNKISGEYLAISLCIIGQKQKSMAPLKLSWENSEIFFGGLGHIYPAVDKRAAWFKNFFIFQDRLDTPIKIYWGKMGCCKKTKENEEYSRCLKWKYWKR